MVKKPIFHVTWHEKKNHTKIKKKSDIRYIDITIILELEKFNLLNTMIEFLKFLFINISKCQKYSVILKNFYQNRPVL